MRYNMMYGFDPTYVLVLIGLVLSLIASGLVKSTFAKYSRVLSRRGITASMAAERILFAAGINDVTIRPVSGKLTDNYDPRNKTLNLSDGVMNSTSVAAIGVAAHECGHAIQHAKGYMPLKARSLFVPVANFGATVAWPLILIGCLFSSQTGSLLINLGILFFALAVLFHLITFPVEFNASRRAINNIQTMGILGEEEIGGTKKVLFAAALTYVASAATAILQLLRLVILFGGRRRD